MITNVTNVPESLKIPNLTIINDIKYEKVHKCKENENMLLKFGSCLSNEIESVVLIETLNILDL